MVKSSRKPAAARTRRHPAASSHIETIREPESKVKRTRKRRVQAKTNYDSSSSSSRRLTTASGSVRDEGVLAQNHGRPRTLTKRHGREASAGSAPRSSPPLSSEAKETLERARAAADLCSVGLGRQVAVMDVILDSKAPDKDPVDSTSTDVDAVMVAYVHCCRAWSYDEQPGADQHHSPFQISAERSTASWDSHLNNAQSRSSSATWSQIDRT